MLDIYYKNAKDKNFKKTKSLRDGAWINIDNAQKEDAYYLYVQPTLEDLKALDET